MATLSQLYNAYLQDDPNVEKMTYDPFGWNIVQTFDDQDDDGGGGGVGEAAGGENYSVLRPDPSTIRLPSSYVESYPGTSSAIRDQLMANQALEEMGIDNPFANEASFKIPYMDTFRNEFTGFDAAPDASQYADVFWDPLSMTIPESQNLISSYRKENPKISKGMSDVDILSEFAPSESIFPDYVSPGYDEEYDIDLEPGKQAWFNKMKYNPLMQALNPFKSAQAIGQMFPVNKRAIMEEQALGSGIALDNIGRVVQQPGSEYKTAENVMAGYNWAKITEDTFTKRLNNIKIKDKEERKILVDAIKGARDLWRRDKKMADLEIQQKNLDRASDLEKTTMKDFATGKMEDVIIDDDPSTHVFKTIPKAAVIAPPAGPDAYGLFEEEYDDFTSDLVQPWPVHHTDKITIEDLADEDEDKKKFLIQTEKKKPKPLETATSITARSSDPNIATAIQMQKEIEQQKAKAANEDMQRRIDAYSGPPTHDIDPKQQRQYDRKAGPMSGPGYGPWKAKGGLIRKKYGNGGIVDLL